MKLFAKENCVALETERGERLDYITCVINKFMTYSNYDRFVLSEEKIDYVDYEGNTQKTSKFVATIYLTAQEKTE